MFEIIQRFTLNKFYEKYVVTFHNIHPKKFLPLHIFYDVYVRNYYLSRPYQDLFILDTKYTYSYFKNVLREMKYILISLNYESNFFVHVLKITQLYIQYI